MLIQVRFYPLLACAGAVAQIMGDSDDDGRRRVVKKWGSDEDAQMVALVRKFGTKKWSLVGSFLPGRNGKQCRERCVYSPSVGCQSATCGISLVFCYSARYCSAFLCYSTSLYATVAVALLLPAPNPVFGTCHDCYAVCHLLAVVLVTCLHGAVAPFTRFITSLLLNFHMLVGLSLLSHSCAVLNATCGVLSTNVVLCPGFLCCVYLPARPPLPASEW